MKNFIAKLTMILVGATVMTTSSVVSAQEIGFLAGFHNTGADSTTAGVSLDSKIGYRLGVPIAFELVPNIKFRTGATYTQRHIEITAGGSTGTVNFEYIDVPILAQYQFNEMFGVFGGLTMALNMKKSIDGIPNTTKATGTEGIVPLVTVGATTVFNDMIGFDFYYEHGIGKISSGAENFSTFGANFIFWSY